MTAGIVGSTPYVRRAMAISAALAEAVILPTVRGGAMAAMGAAMAARFALALGITAAPACLAPRARAAAERAAASSAPRRALRGAARAAEGAARRGLVGRDGEFSAAGPQAQWWWIRKDGVRRGRFALRPWDEYRAAAGARPSRSEPFAGRGPGHPDAAIRVIGVPRSP